MFDIEIAQFLGMSLCSRFELLSKEWFIAQVRYEHQDEKISVPFLFTTMPAWFFLFFISDEYWSSLRSTILVAIPGPGQHWTSHFLFCLLVFLKDNWINPLPLAAAFIHSICLDTQPLFCSFQELQKPVMLSRPSERCSLLSRWFQCTWSTYPWGSSAVSICSRKTTRKAHTKTEIKTYKAHKNTKETGPDSKRCNTKAEGVPRQKGIKWNEIESENKIKQS